MDRLKAECRRDEGARPPLQKREDAAGFSDRRTATAELAAQQRLADTTSRVAQRYELMELADSAVRQHVRDDDNAGGRMGLPHDLRSGIEALSGMDMSAVRVHRNSSEPARLHAHAYAQGTEIHLAPGQEAHLPHEAWHVVQQMQERVRPTLQMRGVSVNDDPGLEREADIMGRRGLAVARGTDDGAGKGRDSVRAADRGGVIQGYFTYCNKKLSTSQIAAIEAWLSKNRHDAVDFKRRAGSDESEGTLPDYLKRKNIGTTAKRIFDESADQDESSSSSSSGVEDQMSDLGESDESSSASGSGSGSSSGSSDDDHAMDAHSRLVRATSRADRRPLPELGKRIDAPTPFGMTGLSRQPFNQNEPQTTSNQQDFPGTDNPGQRYDQWVPQIPNWSAFEESMNEGPHGAPPATFTPQQNRAAAMIYGTSQYSEPYRMSSAPKVARSAVRAKAKGNARPFTHLFPMAQQGGAHAYDDYLKDGTGLTRIQEEIIRNMSSSSSEGTSQSEDESDGDDESEEKDNDEDWDEMDQG